MSNQRAWPFAIGLLLLGVAAGVFSLLLLFVNLLPVACLLTAQTSGRVRGCDGIAMRVVGLSG